MDPRGEATGSIVTNFTHKYENSGSKEEEADIENSNEYFVNEKKVIRNHLKLNAAL
jgi:hypothetical protein